MNREQKPRAASADMRGIIEQQQDAELSRLRGELATANERIAALEAEKSEWQKSAEQAISMANDQAADLVWQQERIAALEAALKPFARKGRKCSDAELRDVLDATILYWLLPRDFRRAAAVLFRNTEGRHRDEACKG